ncbi:MAG: autotransporter domain-containing protein [Cyclobacteriaceae bacterium]|nr:autotransporter domain-containing protein [Cyclobacteriaceae bacterium]
MPRLVQLLFLLIAFHFAVAGSAHAQEDSVNIKNRRLEFFAGPMIDFNPIQGNFFSNAGIATGVIYKNTFSVSIYANTLTWNVKKRLIFPNMYTLRQEQVGTDLGYSIIDRKRFCVHTGFRAGVSRLRWEQDEGPDTYATLMWFIRPQAGIDYKLNRYVRIGAMGGYSFSGDMDLFGLSQGDMDGFSASLYLKAGLFNHIKK